jgi:hypothetical protein
MMSHVRKRGTLVAPNPGDGAGGGGEKLSNVLMYGVRGETKTSVTLRKNL